MIEEKRNSIRDWMPAIELAIVLVTILGSTIPLYLHTDSKMHAEIASMRAETKQFHNDILGEMRDFHGRLCAIEERNKNGK